MYSWNDIKIDTSGTNAEFMNGISKYLNAVYVHDYEGNCDIKVSLMTRPIADLPPYPDDAKHIKSVVFDLDMEIRLDVHTYGTQLWYNYRDMAGIWMDYEKKEMVIAVKGMPLHNEYYNVMIFFLHPLGTLLETMGFFRLHGSCGTMDGKAILFTGTDGSGKSTSAFTIPTHGGQIIADDLTFVHKDEEGYHPSSLTKLVRLGLESVNKFFPELNRVHSASFHDGEIYYFLEDINDVKPEDIRLDTIAVVDKSGRKITGCKPAESSEIMPQLFPSGIHTNIEENVGIKFLFIAEMLDELHLCRITFGTDMNDFVKHVHGILDGADG